MAQDAFFALYASLSWNDDFTIKKKTDPRAHELKVKLMTPMGVIVLILSNGKNRSKHYLLNCLQLIPGLKLFFRKKHRACILQKLPRFSWDKYIYIIITVTWSEVPDHVKLKGTDHQIKRDTERRVWSSDPRLSTRRDPRFGSSYCYNDQFIKYTFNVFKNFELNI